MSSSTQTRKIRTVDVHSSLGWLRQKPWPHQAGGTEERISHLVYDLPACVRNLGTDAARRPSPIYTVIVSGSSIRDMVSTTGYGNVEEED
jgi:hypothetical protein